MSGFSHGGLGAPDVFMECRFLVGPVAASASHVRLPHVCVIVIVGQTTSIRDDAGECG